MARTPDLTIAPRSVEQEPPTRLMVGLHYLKHAYQLSDEEVIRRWVENPYWQYFCGEEYFCYELPIDPSSMSRWRRRVSEAGVEALLAETIEAGMKTQTISAQSAQRVIVDTTVQDKAVRFPTDAQLLHRCREHLVTLAKRYGLGLRQSYVRVGAKALRRHGRYRHAKQTKRAARELRRLKTWLGRVVRDIRRRLQVQAAKRQVLEQKLSQADRLLAQTRSSKNKLYSLLHAPEVECISKGKVHKRYEFGVKVGVVVTHREAFVLGARSYPGNPYDGHTLYESLEQAEILSTVRAKQAYVDEGYRGVEVRGVKIYRHGQRRGITRTLKAAIKRRNAIEPVIGHMKNDGWLRRNYLLGAEGDAINAVLCGAGHNIRLLLNAFRAAARPLRWRRGKKSVAKTARFFSRHSVAAAEAAA